MSVMSRLMTGPRTVAHKALSLARLLLTLLSRTAPLACTLAALVSGLFGGAQARANVTLRITLDGTFNLTLFLLSLAVQADKASGAARSAVRGLVTGCHDLLSRALLALLRLSSTLRIAAYLAAVLLSSLNSQLSGVGSQTFFASKLRAAVFHDFKLSRDFGGSPAVIAGSGIALVLVVQRAKSGARVSLVGATKTYEFCVSTACLKGLLSSLRGSSSLVRVVFHSGAHVPETRAPGCGTLGAALPTLATELYRLVFAGESAAWLSKEGLSPEHRAIYERVKLDPTPEEAERSWRNFGTGQNLVDAIHEAESIPGPVFRVLEAEHLAIPGMTRMRVPMPFMASPSSTTFHGLPWFLDFVHLT
jgi:hypothetical protein